MKNQQGFISVFLVALIPLVLTVLICLYFYLSYSTTLTESRNLCRELSLQTQEQAKNHIQELLNLNPVAQALRTELLIEEAALAAAIAHLNFPLAHSIAARISKVKFLQKKLDQTQKTMIWIANQELEESSANIGKKIKSSVNKYKDQLQSYFQINYSPNSLNIPTLAVRPMGTDIAPDYELEDDFTNKQNLALSWHIQFLAQPQGLFRHWSTHSVGFSESCGASILRKDNQWSTVLTEGKFF